MIPWDSSAGDLPPGDDGHGTWDVPHRHLVIALLNL